MKHIVMPFCLFGLMFAPVEKPRVPLFDAAMRQDIPRMAQLLKAGADRHQTFERMTPLQAAALYGKTRSTEFLLTSLVDKQQAEADKANRARAMLMAARNSSDSPEMVKILLRHDVRYDQLAVLKMAIAYRNYESANILLDKNPSSKMPLDRDYVSQPPLPLLKRLVAGGADVLNGFAGLSLGACGNDIERMKYVYNLDREFFKRPLDPKSLSIHGPPYRPIDSALTTAAAAGALDGIQFLIQAGAAVDHPSNPILRAAENGRTAALELLANHHVSTNFFVRVSLGQTDGMKQIIQDHPELLSARTENSHFGTALHLAVRHQRHQMISWLLGNGADPNLKGYHDRRALHEAAALLDQTAIKMLLENGADPNATTAMHMYTFGNRTALHFALGIESAFEPVGEKWPTEKGAGGIVRLLLDHGASLAAMGESAHAEHSIQHRIQKNGPEWLKALIKKHSAVTGEAKVPE